MNGSSKPSSEGPSPRRAARAGHCSGDDRIPGDRIFGRLRDSRMVISQGYVAATGPLGQAGPSAGLRSALLVQGHAVSHPDRAYRSLHVDLSRKLPKIFRVAELSENCARMRDRAAARAPPHFATHQDCHRPSQARGAPGSSAPSHPIDRWTPAFRRLNGPAGRVRVARSPECRSWERPARRTRRRRRRDHSGRNTTWKC